MSDIEPDLRREDDLATQLTLHPLAELRLCQFDTLSGLAGIIAVIVIHGFHDPDVAIVRVAASAVLAANLSVLTSLGLRYAWSLARSTFVRENAVSTAFGIAWLIGLVLVRIAGLNRWNAATMSEALLLWTELIALGRGLYELVRLSQGVAHARFNPALILVSSFVILIAGGTVLLMLPRCRPSSAVSADVLTAMFTATSACCVTGLVVVDTGTYWSRTGQCVILLLIQLGGLGIMTFGAFFAALAGQGSVRQAATMADLLESEQLSDVRRLVGSIIGFTLLIEGVGAVALSGLWADQPLGEQIFQSVFHSVSAFCNAGFSTRPVGLLGWELRWQVWAGITSLIILGGFGFIALDNLVRTARGNLAWWRRMSIPLSPLRRPRLTLSTRLVTITTMGLLVGGTLVLLLLEWNNPAFPRDPSHQIANAWFHSVTLRTAGFNTIDHGQLSAASKLFGIMLMFVGASPGSTGGGVKTVCLAISVLTLRAVLRGRTNVEVLRRTIPEVQVYRGLAVIALALTAQMIISLLVISIERRPELVLDHLYEVASALGTVGVSTGVTGGLQPASRVALIVTMFLGRVGALTLIAALAGTASEANYEYPEERIILG